MMCSDKIVLRKAAGGDCELLPRPAEWKIKLYRFHTQIDEFNSCGYFIKETHLNVWFRFADNPNILVYVSVDWLICLYLFQSLYSLIFVFILFIYFFMK